MLFLCAEASFLISNIDTTAQGRSISSLSSEASQPR